MLSEVIMQICFNSSCNINYLCTRFFPSPLFNLPLSRSPDHENTLGKLSESLKFYFVISSSIHLFILFHVLPSYLQIAWSRNERETKKIKKINWTSEIVKKNNLSEKAIIKTCFWCELHLLLINNQKVALEKKNTKKKNFFMQIVYHKLNIKICRIFTGRRGGGFQRRRVYK